MKLSFLYTPVRNLKESLRFYCDTLGFEEAWREGEHTAGLKVPGTEVQILLDEDPTEPAAGGFFMVDSVREFYEQNRDALTFTTEPREIPPGMYARFTDPSGNVIRVLDTTKDDRKD